MANLKNIRINTETGKVEYFFPMELTPETEHDFRECIKRNQYQVGWARLGNREFKAAFIPVSEEQYRDLIKDELQSQEQERWSSRCIISDGHGGTKICPRQIPNPAYAEGSQETKKIENRCEDCPHFQSYGLQVGRTILFSGLITVDEEGEEVFFDPAAPESYYCAEIYENLAQEFVDFVREKYPKYAALAELLTQEYSQAEASKKLNRPASTIHSQTKVLRELINEFLSNVNFPY